MTSGPSNESNAGSRDARDCCGVWTLRTTKRHEAAHRRVGAGLSAADQLTRASPHQPHDLYRPSTTSRGRRMKLVSPGGGDARGGSRTGRDRRDPAVSVPPRSPGADSRGGPLGDRGARGRGRTRAVVIEDNRSGEQRRIVAKALFVFIGTTAHTQRLRGRVAMDEHGFVLTGRDVQGEHLAGYIDDRPLSSSRRVCLESSPWATSTPARSSG